MALQQISESAVLKAGDRVLIEFKTGALGDTANRLIAGLIARYNQERAIRAFAFELQGNPVYNPATQTLNFLVLVRGTPLLAIVAAIVGVGAAIGIVLFFHRASLVVGRGVSEGAEMAGAGLGIGLALAGLGVAAFLALQGR